MHQKIMFYRRSQQIHHFLNSKECTAGGLCITKKFSGGALCSSELNVQDAVTVLGALRAIGMIKL